VQRYFVGITGASGHPYARALVRALVAGGSAVDVCVTPSGVKVLRHELGEDVGTPEALARVLGGWVGTEARHLVRAFAADAIEAPAASGTALVSAVILCPCSMGTLARVAAGFSSNLVERAADVALKEGRALVLVPREAPLSALHLENLLRLVRAGAIVLPASPGFYHHPRSVEDLVEHVVGKILDRLGLPHASSARWEGTLEPPSEAGTEPSTETATEPRTDGRRSGGRR
jgi:4-hydroxy-3-polyprenylbenzoate decarboxylase